MASYSTVDGYKFDAQINYGWGLTLNMTGKAPEVSKRIFDTYEHMLYYVNDYNDSCIEGLTLTVVADTDSAKNGVYFVTKIGTNKPEVNENGEVVLDGEGKPVLTNTFANDGKVVKLGAAADASEGISSLQSALDAEIAARKAVDGQEGQEYVANATSNYIKEATSLNDADVKLDAAIKANADEIVEVKSELEGKIADAEAAAKAAASKVAEGTDEGNHLSIGETTDANGAVTYTINLSDIASATALTQEIADRKAQDDVIEASIGLAADGSHVKTSGNYTSEATTIVGEIAALDAQVKENADAIDVIKGEEEGSIKKAVADVKSELLGDAADDYNTLGKLEDKIIAVETAAKSYSINSVSGEELTALGTNVKEAYKLVDEDGAKAGEYIKIYKDSSLKEVKLDGQELKFTYILASGAEETVGVDVSSFLHESEYGDGLKVVNHVISVKVAEGNESFLTVDANGVKLSGVQDAIDAAKSELLGDAAEGYNTLGKLEDKVIALETDKTFVKAVNVNGVEATIANNKATVTIDGSDVKLSSDYESVTYPEASNDLFTPVVAESTIDSAINQLETNVSKLVEEVLSNESVCAAAISKMNEQLGFNENAEFTPCETANYINNAVSVSEALCILDANLKSATGDLGDAIEALDVTDSSKEGKIVVSVSQTNGKVSNEKVSLENIVLSSESTEETKVTLGDKIDSIEQTIADNKAACDAAAAKATSKVEATTTNTMLTVTPEIKEGETATTYKVDLSDTWDCGTFTFE